MPIISRSADAFAMNLKMASNDIYQITRALDRAYYATDDPDQYKKVEHMIEQLSQIRNDIQEILDKS
jgi:flagellum-specific peptidoglycan hydrolase FlgJ